MKLAIATIALLALFSEIKSEHVDPNVQAGSTLFDLRKSDMELRTRDDVNTMYVDTNDIDLSAKKARNVFKELRNIDQVDGARNMRMKYILHTDANRDVGSNRFLEEWSMEPKENNMFSVVARLRMLDLNDTTNSQGFQETIVKFDCKHHLAQKLHICIPEKCSFEGLVKPTDPVQKCVANYRESQMVLSVVNESTDTQVPKTVGDEVQLLMIKCMQKQIETLTVRGDTICYYEGFKPENMVTYKEMKESILANNDWVETDTAGTFSRTTVIKEWEIDTLIDTSVPELVEEEIRVIHEINPDEIPQIHDQLNFTDLDMSKGTRVSQSTP